MDFCSSKVNVVRLKFHLGRRTIFVCKCSTERSAEVKEMLGYTLCSSLGRLLPSDVTTGGDLGEQGDRPPQIFR